MTNQLNSLSGKVALVTGGTRGIGRAITEHFLSAGATVVMVSRQSADTTNLGIGENKRLHHRTYNVSEPLGAGKLVEDVIDQLGRIDILVNNAGIHLKKAAEETTPEELEEVIRTHITGAHALAAKTYTDMKKRGQGSIIFIASMASFIGLPGAAAYSVAKTGVLGLVRTLASEWSPHGIRVNAIAPGWIETDMLRKVFDANPERRDRVLQRTPMNRLGTAKEVASAAHFLCSDEASFITGIVMPVDGGASIGF